MAATSVSLRPRAGGLAGPTEPGLQVGWHLPL